MRASTPSAATASVINLVLPVRPAAFVAPPIIPPVSSIGMMTAAASRSAFFRGSVSVLRPDCSSHQSAGFCMAGMNLEVRSMTVSTTPATERARPPISLMLVSPGAVISRLLIISPSRSGPSFVFSSVCAAGSAGAVAVSASCASI